GPRERPPLRPAAQREGAGRKSVGLVAADGDKAMINRSDVASAFRRTGPAEAGRHARTFSIVALWGFFAVMLAGQQPPAPVYTAAQATAGRTAYQANCASCHLPDLAGRNEAPPLAGANFMNTWRARTTRDLFEYIQSAMPPSGDNLGADVYLSITAFILQ